MGSLREAMSRCSAAIFEGVKMSLKKWKAVREIKERRTLNVSSHGRGLYLYLPKDFCEVYDVIGGDRVKVQLLELFKRDHSEEEKGEEQHKRGDRKGELKE